MRESRLDKLMGSNEKNGSCRFGWHPKVLVFFVAAALGLSIMSSLDCNFLSVGLSWVPQNYYEDELGFGLWSYAAPGGRCLSYDESRHSGVFGDNIYSNLLINNDTNWSISRILALVSFVFGAIALISVGMNICKSEPRLVDVLAYSTITAFLSECSKFGLFLGTNICTSEDYWLNTESNELLGSKDCAIDRGAFMSIGSIAAYLVSIILTVGFAARPQMDDFQYEEASLPSWMASETGSSAQAHASTRPDPEIDPGGGRSVVGYDWSHSAPSTIPTITEEYGIEGEEDQPVSKQNANPVSIPAYPPVTNAPPKRYDDCSTLTWDPGY